MLVDNVHDLVERKSSVALDQTALQWPRFGHVVRKNSALEAHVFREGVHEGVDVFLKHQSHFDDRHGELVDQVNRPFL